MLVNLEHLKVGDFIRPSIFSPFLLNLITEYEIFQIVLLKQWGDIYIIYTPHLFWAYCIIFLPVSFFYLHI